MLGGIFIVASDALKVGSHASPPFHMQRALVFEAVVAVAVAPGAFALGWVGGRMRTTRLDVDKGRVAVEGEVEE